MTDEAAITDRHEVADEAVRLDAAVAADDGAGLDLHERTDEAAIPDPATVQVHRPHDPDVDAEIDVDDVGFAEAPAPFTCRRPGPAHAPAGRASG